MGQTAAPRFGDFGHGVRSRYVQGCRCDACRAANAAYYHVRKRAQDAAALELAPEPAAGFTHFGRTKDGKRRVRRYKRKCPGVHGKPCPDHRYLRKDSKGGLCRGCRAALAYNGLVDAAPARRHIRKLSRQGVGYKTVADAAVVAENTVWKIAHGEKKKIRAETLRRVLDVSAGARADGEKVPAKRTWKLVHRLLKEGFTKAELARRLGYKRGAIQFGRERVTLRTQQKVARFYNMIMAEADE